MAMMKTKRQGADRNERRYIAAAMEAPMLERAHEADLARKWREHHAQSALNALITSHIRLVVRIASAFRTNSAAVRTAVRTRRVVPRGCAAAPATTRAGTSGTR